MSEERGERDKDEDKETKEKDKNIESRSSKKGRSGSTTSMLAKLANENEKIKEKAIKLPSSQKSLSETTTTLTSNPNTDVKNNAAAELFLASNALAFQGLYGPDIFNYRLGMINNKAKCIAVVFLDEHADDNTRTFEYKLKNLVKLSKKLGRPALFISKEPGADSHFICGLIKDNNLLYINPFGMTSHLDYYKTLVNLKEREVIGAKVDQGEVGGGIIKEICLSQNSLQKQEYEKGIVSCGPITLELAINILENFTPEQFDDFWITELKVAEQITHQESGLIYYETDIKTLLPDALIQLENSSEKTDYQNKVLAIRQDHYKQLQSLPAQNSQNLGLSVENYLNKCKEDDVQVIFMQLTQEGSRLEEMKEFKSLQERLNTQTENRDTSSQSMKAISTSSKILSEKPKKKEKEKSSQKISYGTTTATSTTAKISTPRKGFDSEENEKRKNTNDEEENSVMDQDIEDSLESSKDEEEYDFSYRYLGKVLKTFDDGKELHIANIEKEYAGCQYLPGREFNAETGKAQPFYHIFRKFKKGEKTELNAQLTATQKSQKAKLAEEGLKFHISLPEDDSKVDSNANAQSRTYYAKGWKIVQKILRKHDVYHFKIADDTVRMSEPQPGEPNQTGKNITIYAHQQVPYKTIKQWLSIVEEIAQALINGNVPPGLKPVDVGGRADRSLQDNAYVSYRYDCVDRGMPAPTPDPVKKAWAKLKHLDYDASSDEDEAKNDNNRDDPNQNDNDQDERCKCDTM